MEEDWQREKMDTGIEADDGSSILNGKYKKYQGT